MGSLTFIASCTTYQRMFYFDPLYIMITLVALGLSLWAQALVKWAFAKYSKIPNAQGLTGAEVAEKILERQGIRDVTVTPTSKRRWMGIGGDGMMDDHYDPRVKAVRLSPDVYNGRSQAAVAIAAHEVGHAIQHARAYAPFKMRSQLAPAAAFGSNISFYLIFVGFLMHAMSMVKIGILLFSIAVVFQFITLPVEWNASQRAKRLVREYGIVQGNESVAVAKVLNAAALTYVAAAAAALLNLLYLLFRSGFLGGRRN